MRSGLLLGVLKREGERERARGGYSIIHGAVCECVWSRSGLVDVSESGWSLLSSLSQITPLKRGQSPTVTGSIAAASGLSHSGDRPRCRPVPSLPPIIWITHTRERGRGREMRSCFTFFASKDPYLPHLFSLSRIFVSGRRAAAAWVPIIAVVIFACISFFFLLLLQILRQIRCEPVEVLK